jgi:DNA-binding LytR/AlgR family response regulator
VTLRVLVCDDEPIAVSRMVALLTRIPGVEVIATAMDGGAALAAVASARPDLLFLDIEMPGWDGFDVVRETERLAEATGGAAPLITFVTAYQRLAPEAFDSGAVDFLSKPVRLSRLEQCIARARRHVAARKAEAQLAHLEERVEALQAQGLSVERPHVWVQRRSEMVRIDLDGVERIQAEGPYVRLHVGGSTFLHREAIGLMEVRLGSATHLRVHRSHIVRIGQVSRIRRTPNGGVELFLRDDVQVPVGRSYAKEVRRRLLHLDALE